MPRCLTRVAEILGLAESKKITDRRTFIKDLQEIYASDEYVKAINDETSKDFKGPVSWNQIMLTIHRVFVTESEKAVTKATKGNTAAILRSRCCDLIKRTIKLAISTEGMSLSCDDFMAMIFQIFGKSTYEFCYDTYISILLSVLANRSYRSAINLEQWQEVLKLVQRIYFQSQVTVKVFLLDIARIVVQYGCLQSHLTLDIKKMLPFLEQVYHKLTSGKETKMRAVYKLTYAVCQQIGTESGIALCEFSEKILPAVITLYGCPEKYNMMLLLIRIHHPNGAVTSDDGAYACDWERWKNILRGIYASIVRDIKSDKMPPCFLELASEVYRLAIMDDSYISNVTPTCNDSDDTQPRKRRRLSTAVRKPVDMLLDNDLEITWFSVQVLTILLRRYPDTLKLDEYEFFLKTVTELVAASLNNEKIMDSLCSLCTVLVNAEKEHWHDAETAESTKICWEKIWDTILRALSMNQNEKCGHALLQSIIEKRGAVDPQGILRLYLTNAIRWSYSSVKSLLTLCEYTPIPEELFFTGAAGSSKPEVSTRISLIQWSLDMPSKQLSHLAFPELADLLTALVVRSWYEREFRDYRNIRKFEHQRKVESQASMRNDLFDDREQKYFNDIERCALSLNFRSNASDLIDEEPQRSTETKPRIFHEQEALEYLVDALNAPIDDRAIVHDPETSATKLAIVAKVLSNFGELNVRSEPRTSNLVNTFEQHFKKVSSFIVANQNTLKFDYLVRVIEVLEILYATRYNREIAQILSSHSSMDFLKFIFNLSEDHGVSDNEDDENAQSFSAVHGNHSRKVSDRYFNTSNERSRGFRLRNSAYNILTYFCCTPIDDKTLDAKMRVLRNLMKISLYENTSNADLRCALEVLKIYGTYGQFDEASEESLEIANNFIRQLLDSRIKEETAVRGILNVLPHFLEASVRFIRETEKLLEILSIIRKRLKKNQYGPLVLGDFVKCIAAIARSNPSLRWVTKISADPSPVIDVLLDYIDNPFYLVRIEVVRALRNVFVSKDLRVPAKVDFFKRIEAAIPELFTIEEISNEFEKMDEHQTRTSTAVQIYATIIRASGYLTSRALYSMISLSVLGDVKIKTIGRALLCVTKSKDDQRRLIELNLHDLLSRWFQDNYPLQLFPWTLVDCDSQEDFSRRHIRTLLSIKLQRCEFQQLATLCNNLEVAFATTVEDCFPIIMTQLVSMIVQEVSEGGTPERVAYAKSMYSRLCHNTHEFEAVESFDLLLKNGLSEVLINLVQRLRDDENFFEMFSRRVFLPEIDPPNLTAGTIDRCLSFMEKVLRVGPGNSLVEYLVIRCPNVLQRVYEALFCNISAIDSEDRKLRAFHQYCYFGRIILRELQKPCFDPMSHYIVRDTCYSLLSLTKDQSFAEMACNYLDEFLRGSMPVRSSEIKQVLNYVVSSLVPLARSSIDHGATRIIEYLIIDQREQLADAIEKLDSFPNVESFEIIQRVHRSLKYGGTGIFSLENEIEHFLNATTAKTLSCSHEGLVHVKNQLASRKEELRDMYARLEGLRGFAEDCASSTLHKLIYKLVQLTGSSDTSISLEAAKCLGELGPADLTTMILHAENVYSKENGNEVAMLTARVTSQLIDYLVDNNSNLRRASSSALYEILSTPWGHDLARDWTQTDRDVFIYPFVDRAKSSRKPGVFRVDRDNWQSCIDPANDSWTPVARDAHDPWITELTCKLLDCFVNLYTPCLKPVCRESVEFCEILLPRLVNLVRSVDARFVNDACICVNRFFSRVYKALGEADVSMTISESPVKNGDASLSHESVRSMINVVNFMRIQTSENAPLCLDYLYIARAAQYCSAYFTSVLYAELWCQYLLQNSRLLQDKVPGSWISAIDCICESKPEPGRLLQSIVREAYSQIGDPDSIYGCGSAHLIDSSYRVQHYVHLRQWDKVLLAQDVEMCSGNSSTRGILHALQQSCLHGLMFRYISTVNKEQGNVDDFTYEAAWRLADWSIVEPQRANENADVSTCPIGQSGHASDYHSSHYRALKSLRDNDYLGLKMRLDDARTSLIVSLRKISLECSRTVYPILSQLQMLREIEDFTSIETDEKELEKWRRNNCLSSHDFQWIEPILYQRLIIYGSSGRSSDFTKRALIETHLEMAEIAEKQGYLANAARTLDALSRHDLSSSARDESTYQEAFVAWKRNDRDIARYLVRNLLKRSNLSANLRAKALRVYGNWMAVTKSENPQAIIEKYYEESIRTSLSIANKSSRDTDDLTGAQADLAQFADAQYQQIVEFMRSPQYENLRESTRLRSDRSGQSIAARGRDERKAIHTYQQQMTNDAAELERIQREKERYLVLSAKYYLMTLQSGDEHDFLLFRLVSLWLDNTYHEGLNVVLDNQLRSVPSHKFIILLPQLAPHMSTDRDAFTNKIGNLMKRCALEHPHHTLPVLLALKNTHRDNEFTPVDKNARRMDAGNVEPRILAAEALIAELVSSPIKPIIRQMSDLSQALIALAYFKVPESKKKDAVLVIPRTQPITKIRNYANACVPTLTVPVRAGCNYNDVVGIREYVTNFDLPGGVNAPKKVVCVGTDGVKRTQLVKGQDDLRQDAVMQQVCDVMNDMLRTSKETKKRKLHIRTYKIVPLSSRSGILEWCENTLPISHVLCDVGKKPGMHTKYYPDDWSVAKCRAKLYAVDKASFEVKRDTFLECCRNLHPAFHHFFMEKYPSAETWFERRLAYVRSVATTSMVGYILGLGDRHFSNILIDQTTAEVIHIDFGIAFAQGMFLPIPETVPFRLTRDMEVAMGICGVEGVMRRSCEETVAVLRDRSEIVCTLLQVLLYDPLFSWTIIPGLSDAGEDQNTRGHSGNLPDDRGTRKSNKAAERALLKIEQKLQGTEDGISSSISGQVERLIQQARDPMNLCRLYSGWQAYL